MVFTFIRLFDSAFGPWLLAGFRVGAGWGEVGVIGLFDVSFLSTAPLLCIGARAPTGGSVDRSCF